MSEENCVSIEIIKKIPFFGEGDTLTNRLRKVSLRGFTNIKIYENAEFEFVTLTKEQVLKELSTPQPNVHKEKLERIGVLYKLFAEKGINIFELDYAYDFISVSDIGEKKQWTMIPPIVEQFQIPRDFQGRLDYQSLIGKELLEVMQTKNYKINSEIYQLENSKTDNIFNEINDGSHRVHYAIENVGRIKIIKIKKITPGFPYYALPLDYSNVKLIDKRDEFAKETKIHLIDPPGHKELYRLFPSGGIMTGEVRPDPKLICEKDSILNEVRKLVTNKESETIKKISEIIQDKNEIKILSEGKIGDRPSWDEYFMKMAISAASRSSCHQVCSGSVVVADNKIVGTGYNGAPPGIKSCLADGQCYKEKITGEAYEKNIGKGNCIGVHSEINALAHLNRLLNKDTTLYTTIFPCLQCTKVIIAYKIKRVVVKKEYDKEEMNKSLKLFSEAGIEVCKLDLSKERLMDIDFHQRAKTFNLWN